MIDTSRLVTDAQLLTTYDAAVSAVGSVLEDHHVAGLHAVAEFAIASYIGEPPTAAPAPRHVTAIDSWLAYCNDGTAWRVTYHPNSGVAWTQVDSIPQP